MLFEVALIQKPTKKDQEAGLTEVLILAPTPILAENSQAAGIRAVVENKEKITGDLSRVEVLVRPFA